MSTKKRDEADHDGETEAKTRKEKREEIEENRGAKRETRREKRGEEDIGTEREGRMGKWRRNIHE